MQIRFVTVTRVLSAQAEEFLLVDLQPAHEIGEVVLDELRGEDIVAGGHRGVGGEHVPADTASRAAYEVEAGLLHEQADPLQARKR